MNTYIDEFLKAKTSGISFFDYSKRQELVNKYAWAIPTKEAIKEIVKYSPIIEIGAGRGYWASLIKHRGGEIICFDMSLPPHDFAQKSEDLFFPVEIGTSNKIKKYLNHTLFLCWPNYNSSFAADCLKKYIGKYFLYVGEVHGCTGDDEFFEILSTKWEEIKCIDIPQWDGLHDRFFVFERL